MKRDSFFTMKYIFIPLLLLIVLGSCNLQKKLAEKRHRYMENSFTAIQKGVQEAEISILNDSIKILFPEHLLFPLGKSAIRPETYPLLQRLAKALNKMDKTSILITGFTDNSGSENWNMQLSQKRAENTKEVLLKNSVRPSRIFTWGRGSRDAIASNGTESGRKRNRRVEFIILYNYKPPH